MKRQTFIFVLRIFAAHASDNQVSSAGVDLPTRRRVSDSFLI